MKLAADVVVTLFAGEKAVFAMIKSPKIKKVT